MRYWSLVAIKHRVPHMSKSGKSGPHFWHRSHPSVEGLGSFRLQCGFRVGGKSHAWTCGDLADCVVPGLVLEMGLWQGMATEEMQKTMEKAKKRSVTGEIGHVEDIAEGYACLVHGDFTMGQTLILDCGEMLIQGNGLDWSYYKLLCNSNGVYLWSCPWPSMCFNEGCSLGAAASNCLKP